MSDLIDRQALLKQIEIDSEGIEGSYGDMWKFIDTIKNMPSVDVATDLQPENRLLQGCKDIISRQQAIDVLRKMQTYKLFSGDDMLLIDQAGAMTELMLLPSTDPQERKVGTDLISRQVVIDLIEDCGLFDSGYDIINLQTQVMELPTAEPQIIYCKDCKHYEHDVGNEEYGVCCNPQWVVGNVGCGVTSNDFCSYAERREVTT